MHADIYHGDGAVNPARSLLSALDFARPLIERGERPDGYAGWLRVLLSATPVQLLTLYGSAHMPLPSYGAPMASPVASRPKVPLLPVVPLPVLTHRTDGKRPRWHRSNVARTIHTVLAENPVPLSTQEIIALVVARCGCATATVRPTLSSLSTAGTVVRTSHAHYTVAQRVAQCA